MSPEDFQKTAMRIYGRKFWKAKLSRDLGVDVSTIHRLTHRAQVPGPYEVALKGLAEHARRQRELDKAARKLLPRKFRKRKVVKKSKPVEPVLA